MLRTKFGLQVRLPQSIEISIVYQFDLPNCDAGVTGKEDWANEMSITCKHTFPCLLFILTKEF